MRPSLLILGAASLVAAQNCNPTFNVTSSGECIQKCSVDAGKSVYPDYTTDPKSPNFLKSVSTSCAKGTPDYIAFMTKAGTCWLTCDKSQQDAYTQHEFKDTCTWYEQHKNDKCDATASTSGSAASAKPTSASNQLQVTGVVGMLALSAAALLL